MGAMLEMMEQMMGKNSQNNSQSTSGGQGASQSSDSVNEKNTGPVNSENPVQRRIPRATGKSGTKLPPEFQKTLDAYNQKNNAP